jgi:hypothetical protein
MQRLLSASETLNRGFREQPSYHTSAFHIYKKRVKGDKQLYAERVSFILERREKVHNMGKPVPITNPEQIASIYRRSVEEGLFAITTAAAAGTGKEKIEHDALFAKYLTSFIAGHGPADFLPPQEHTSLAKIREYFHSTLKN